MGTPALADITGSGAPLSMGEHVIRIYGSQQQRWDVLTPFLAAGLMPRQQTLVITANYGGGRSS